MARRQTGTARIGAVLRGKWRLEALLGEGGMADVYAATHRNGMRGAVKVLRPEGAGDGESLRRFLLEGYVANRVDHPGAVKVLDDDVTDDGCAFLVMELLDGESLKARSERHGSRLPVHEVVAAGIEILDVLVTAHQRGVVHRDIKPANVFVTSTGRVKLLDFGIARVREPSSLSMTRTGSLLGTPAFMAPEQALAKWSRVDGRSDVFAVGATLWTLLAGQLVHDADTITDLLIAASTQRARRLRTVVPEVDAELADIVDRALEFDPEARWQDATSMCVALIGVRERLRAQAIAETHQRGAGPHLPRATAPATAPAPADDAAPGLGPVALITEPMSVHGAPDAHAPAAGGHDPQTLAAAARSVRPGHRRVPLAAFLCGLGLALVTGGAFVTHRLLREPPTGAGDGAPNSDIAPAAEAASDRQPAPDTRPAGPSETAAPDATKPAEAEAPPVPTAATPGSASQQVATATPQRPPRGGAGAKPVAPGAPRKDADPPPSKLPKFDE
ncbi:MAG: protein kinase [Polyangiaceae bacterium]